MKNEGKLNPNQIKSPNFLMREREMEKRERERELAWPGLNWSEVGEEDEVVGRAHGLVGLLDVMG